jgi:hypothetical protein
MWQISCCSDTLEREQVCNDSLFCRPTPQGMRSLQQDTRQRRRGPERGYNLLIMSRVNICLTLVLTFLHDVMVLSVSTEQLFENFIYQ